MNAQQIIDSIQGTQTNDPRALAIAQSLAEYTQAFQAGQMSKDEYLELIQDLQRESLINAQCDDLAAKERLNTIINAVVSAASVLSSL